MSGRRRRLADRFPHVPPDRRAAFNWHLLRRKGDAEGLAALEEELARAETEAEVRALRFCGCGCGRLHLGPALERLFGDEGGET